MNELLGGWDTDGIGALADLPKTEAGEHERRPVNFQLDLSEVTACRAGN